MPTVKDVFEYLDSIAPVEMKMGDDNVGFLVGRAGAGVTRIVVSLDITGEVVQEALELGAELIVSHHPLFFSRRSVTDEDATGKILVQMLAGGLSAICMHTNLDAAEGGVNDALATAAGISGDCGKAELLSVSGRLPTGEAYSYGRVGRLKAPCPLPKYMRELKAALKADGLRYHDAGREVCTVAVVGGSGGDEFHNAVLLGCDTFVTGEMKYHMFLEAKELGVNLVEGGHFQTENLITDVVACKLRVAFPEVKVDISQRHTSVVKFF